MEKEFIPYEEALALKELGFDEPCLCVYIDCGVGAECFIKSIYDNRCKEHQLLAPLYQQAFRWFREKHKLYHTIKMFGDWDNPQFSYIVSGRTITNPAHMWHYESKDSHEEAELACLIKLIEVVKNK